MKEYDVTITETLKMTVTVEAESQLEAEQMVSDNWRGQFYRRGFQGKAAHPQPGYGTIRRVSYRLPSDWRNDSCKNMT